MSFFKNQKLAKTYLIYLICFYIVWILKAFALNPILTQVIEKDSVAWYLVSDGIIKNICWTLPAVLLIKKFDDDLYIHKKELFSKPADWKGYLPIFGYVTAFCIIHSIISHKGFYFNPDGLIACIAFLFVGVTEEFVFRGFLLNATYTEKNKYFALGLNALLFLCIHFPSWMIHGEFVTNFVSLRFIFIILLSLLFSWTMLKFRNIWIPVGLHMLWDILVELLN